MKRKPARVTICVLTFGAYPSLARRCLGSILRYCSRDLCEIVVGANAPCPETAYYLSQLLSERLIDALEISQTNINKCPMMRRMLAHATGEYVWWFDDDSYIFSSNALDARITAADTAPADVVGWGHVHFVRSNSSGVFNGFDVASFVRSAAWYQGRPLPSDSPEPRWFFMTGGCWFLRTVALRKLGWPDPRITMELEDVILGAALHQQRWNFRDLGSCGVAISAAMRRGDHRA